jgi:hypothetical protein
MAGAILKKPALFEVFSHSHQRQLGIADWHSTGAFKLEQEDLTLMTAI